VLNFSTRVVDPVHACGTVCAEPAREDERSSHRSLRKPMLLQCPLSFAFGGRAVLMPVGTARPRHDRIATTLVAAKRRESTAGVRDCRCAGIEPHKRVVAVRTSGPIHWRPSLARQRGRHHHRFLRNVQCRIERGESSSTHGDEQCAFRTICYNVERALSELGGRILDSSDLIGGWRDSKEITSRREHPEVAGMLSGSVPERFVQCDDAWERVGNAKLDGRYWRTIDRSAFDRAILNKRGVRLVAVHAHAPCRAALAIAG